MTDPQSSLSAEPQAHHGILRRVARHTGVMGSGKIVGGVLHLASLALAARMLGPVMFGVLMLVRSYVQTAGGLAKFQSWQAVIRYGTPLVQRDDREGFAGLIGFTGGLDVATGGAAALIAAALLPAIGVSFGLEPEYILFALLYCLAIPGMAATTPTGILRLFERFDHLAWQSLITPSVRFVGLGLAWILDAPFWGYWLAWLISDLVGDLYLWLVGARELFARGFSITLPKALGTIPAQHPGIIRFIASTNISGTLDTLFGPLAALFIGARLGVAEAGQFRMALAILDAVGKPAELAMRSFYPEIAKLKHEGHSRHFREIVLKAVLIAGVFGAVVSAVLALAAPSFIGAVMGVKYAPVAPLLQIVGLSVLGAMVVFPLEAALLAHGHAGWVLIGRLIATLGGFAVLFALISSAGINGAGWAMVASAILLTVALSLALIRSERGASSNPT